MQQIDTKNILKNQLETRMIIKLMGIGSMYVSDLQNIFTDTEDMTKHQEFYNALYNLEYKRLVHIKSFNDIQTVSIIKRDLQ